MQLFWDLREFLIENVTIHAPTDSPYTSGIVPDSSVRICFRYCNISTSHDAITLKSGWDEYGVTYGKPTANIHLQSSSGSALSFGSEMSGGISGVLVENIHLQNSPIGIQLKTTRGRGGYLQDIVILKAEMTNLHVALKATGHFGFHPDNNYDPNAFPTVRDIVFTDIIGKNITVAGFFTGMSESPFSWFMLSNIRFDISPVDPSSGSSVWICSDVFGSSHLVFPEPCPELRIMFLENSSFSVLSTEKQTASM